MIVSSGNGKLPLAIDATLGGSAMAPMGVNDLVFGDLPQPKMNAENRARQIILQPAVGLNEHILHDVANIDPPLNLAIQPHLNHSAERIAMPVQEAIDCLLIAAASAGKQLLGLVRVGPHARYYG